MEPKTEEVLILHPCDLKAKRQEIWGLIEGEMKRSKKKYPSFPVHAAARAGVVVKQSGEIMAAAMDMKYNGGDGERIEKLKMKAAAVKTIVAAFRLIESI